MEISEVLKRALRFFEQIQKATDDDSPGGSKITLVELPGFISPTLQLIPTFAEFKNIASQFKGISDEEKQALKDQFKAEFTLDNPILEAKIERLFDWIVETGDLVFDLKELSEAQKAESQPGAPGHP